MKINNVSQGTTINTIDRNNDIIKDKPNLSNQQNVKSRQEASIHQENKEIDRFVEGKNELDKELLDRSIRQANKTLKMHNRIIERNVHETTKTVMYKVKDVETDEVIAEFPPKKIQDMIAKMWELAGLFVDEKA